MSKDKTDKTLQLLIALVLGLNILFWFSLRGIEARWGNVPPPPDEKFAAGYGLGDASFAYRMNSIMLQNLGDTGGRLTALKDYNYERLTEWFFLQDKLDPISNYIPYVAAYYFGGVQEPEKYRPVFAYLEDIGTRTYGEKWRWLAHGVHIARYYLKDNDKALELAYLLAATKHPDTPSWVQQMPVFIINTKGDRESAYALMLEILKSSADKLHPNEVAAIKDYICLQILDTDQAAENPLCENVH